MYKVIWCSFGLFQFYHLPDGGEPVVLATREAINSTVWINYLRGNYFMAIITFHN
jgi:hypothetical protein